MFRGIGYALGIVVALILYCVVVLGDETKWTE